MKGFFGALCIFLLWTAACIYYVSTSELSTPESTNESPSEKKVPLTNPARDTVTNEVISDSLTPHIDVLENYNQDTEPELTIENREINTLNKTESKFLADELLKSIAVSDTVDFDRDEPELKFENSIEISSEPDVISNSFYPYYKNTDLIIDEKLVAYVKEIRQILKDEPSKKITVIGHTDNVGNGRDNFDIGLKKARQVKWYLTARRGIPRNKIKAISRGEQEPIQSNNSLWGRKKNNRVEIIVQ